MNNDEIWSFLRCNLTQAGLTQLDRELDELGDRRREPLLLEWSDSLAAAQLPEDSADCVFCRSTRATCPRHDRKWVEPLPMKYVLVIKFDPAEAAAQ